MGRKKVKCKICNKKFDTIIKGKGHVSIHHKIKYSKTRDYLEEIEEGD